MILLQSYSSPSELSEDKGVYKVLKENFPELKVIYKKDSRINSLRTKDFLKMALKVNSIKDDDNIIFGWGADACLYAWLFGVFTFRKKNYLSQNLIVRENVSQKKGFINSLRFYLYKAALKSKNFYVTVNSEGLINYYTNIFKCKPDKFFVVYDSMSLGTPDKPHNTIANQQQSDYVFCGGKSCRDIKTFTQIVIDNPDINFVCVFPEKMLTSKLKSLKNLKAFSDIPKEEFDNLLDNALICCIPLNSNAPCGLFVMQRAVLNSIPIVSSETFSMKTLIPNDNYGFLFPIGDSAGMTKAIRLLYASKEIRERISINAKKNFYKFEPHNVGKVLCSVIKKLIVPSSNSSN